MLHYRRHGLHPNICIIARDNNSVFATQPGDTDQLSIAGAPETNSCIGEYKPENYTNSYYLCCCLKRGYFNGNTSLAMRRWKGGGQESTFPRNVPVHRTTGAPAECLLTCSHVLCALRCLWFAPSLLEIIHDWALFALLSVVVVLSYLQSQHPRRE